MRIVLWQGEFFLVFLSGLYACLTADTFFPDEPPPPPPPEFIPVFPSPPPPPPPPPLPHVASTDYLVSPKCSRFLNLGEKPKIMKMGEPLTLVFMPLIMACEDIICTKMYNASCSPQKCPRCKSYSGPGDHFKAQVEDTNGTDVGTVCNVRKMFPVYGIACIGRNGFANLTRSYVVRVYARQSNGTMVTVENVATVVLGAGDASIVNSGPGYWPTGNGLMVGSLSSFLFPVKDNYNNIKKDLSGEATASELNQFEVKYSSYVKAFNLTYNKKSGYAKISFIPTKVGNWTLSIGSIGKGSILGSPYLFNVATSGPINSENCLASWSSGSTTKMAGELGYITIYLKDAYNNTVDISTGWSDTKNFNLTLMSKMGQICKTCTILTAVPGAGYETAIVNATIAGDYNLNISDGHKVVLGSPISFTIIAGLISVKNCHVFWLNNTSIFKAGDQAILIALVMDSYKNNISDVTGRKILYRFNVFSNSSLNEIYYYNVNFSFDMIPGYERIGFFPTKTGRFVVHVTYNDGELLGSPLNFTVTPGVLSIPHCQGFWLNNVSIFTAGERATLLVSLMDAYDNNIISISPNLNLSTLFFDTTGQQLFFNVEQIYDGNSSYLLISFNTSISNDLLLQVGKGNVQISGSPFLLHVDPGSIFPSYCQGFWVNNINTFSVGSIPVFNVMFKDSYNNTINASDITWVNISATIENGGATVNFSVLNISAEMGSVFANIYFTSFTSGAMFLHVKVDQSEIAGSPYAFKMLPGTTSLGFSSSH